MQVCHLTFMRMALSAAFYSSRIPKTQSSLLSVPKSHSLTRTMSLLPPQATQKFLYQPLRYKRISPIVVNPKRCFSKVKALKKGEKICYKTVEVFSEEYLDVCLAHDIYKLSKKFIKERGAFSVVLSDGSSVKYLRKLYEPPYINTIEWSKWYFYWVEEPLDEKERVALDFAKDEHKLAYDELLSKVPKEKLNVESIENAYYPDRQVGVSKNVKTNHLPKFDLMVLGMDQEGHVDSLSPVHPDVLNEKEKWATIVKEKDETGPGPARIALTLPVINSCSHIAMVVAGSATADAVYFALKDDDGQARRKLPAKLVSPKEGQLKWYLDEGAASKM